MKLRFITSFLCSILFFAVTQAVIPYYSIRSQSTDAARELAGWTQHINLYDQENLYGSLALTAEYSRSFKPHQITQCLFDTQCACPSITIAGSRAYGRTTTDWLADYFYLPTDFKSVVSFSPRIDNMIVDANVYLGFDAWAPGLFFRIHAPLVWTRWNLGMTERIVDPGINAYDPGYVASYALARDTMLESFIHFAQGDVPAPAQNDMVNTVTLTGLNFARLDPCSQSLVRLSDIQMILGWNIFATPCYHAGIGLRLVAPTGNRPLANFLFEPIVGNGKHWEAGVHLTSHYMFFNTPEDHLGIYADANITHLFKTLQRRTFDVKGKPFSRYMLMEGLTKTISNNLVGSLTTVGAGFVTPFAQFDKEFAPLANISTQEVRVDAAIQVDLAAQLTYVHCGFTWDIGYNFWYRSCEKIHPVCNSSVCCITTFEEEAWGLKGDAQVWGFASAPDAVSPTLTLNQAVALSATESNATIFSGTNFPATGSISTNNAAIDNPQFAFAGGTPTALTTITNGTVPSNSLQTSIDPIFIAPTDLDFVGSAGMSQKFYTHVNYTWFEHCGCIPFFGAGCFAEFGSTKHCNDRTCTVQCGTRCTTCSLSQWGIWLKGGVSF